jgi:hypothetical protein
LTAAGLIEAQSIGLGRAQGRPGSVFRLTTLGLSHARRLGGDIAEPRHGRRAADLLPSPDHQLLLNWCLLHLLGLKGVHAELEVAIFHPAVTLPCEEREDQAPMPAESLIPDAIFTVASTLQHKTLLFFLEVDMGTETVASPSRSRADFRSKIQQYQEVFRSQAYKRYEALSGCPLCGFRLLVLANSRRRLTSLCRLVRETPPSDFVWLTEERALFAAGISAPIWFRGGKQDVPTQSILGPTLSCVAPLLPVKP